MVTAKSFSPFFGIGELTEWPVCYHRGASSYGGYWRFASSSIKLEGDQFFKIHLVYTKNITWLTNF